MSENTHKCRTPGPCWGCGHQIERSETYVSTVVWAENGPRRTKRLHPECLNAILRFNLEDWDSWGCGDNLHSWQDFADSCPYCKADRLQAATETPAEAKGGDE